MATAPFRNYVAGEWVAGATVTLNRNPSDLTDVIGEYAQADAAQARAAIAAAKQAFPGWANGNVQERANILDRAGNEILACKDELGRLLSREEGKTLPEGIGEAARAGNIFKFFAGEALRLSGEKVPSVRPGIDVDITREPLGVVGLITPWNFPIAIPAWKIAPALAYGNTVVMKPADLVPGCSWAIAEILAKAGLPAGVFNLVMGRGSVVGEALVTNPDVAGVSFTGSVDTGRGIAAKAVARMAKIQLEMGGKNPLVILDDADLATAVNCAVQGAYFSTGQRCTASSRLIVTDGIHDRFVAALAEKLKSLKIDDALAPGTDIGPVVDQSQLDTDLKYVDIGRGEGAKLALGGERVKRAKDGYYLAPALFTDATNAMRIAREEIFGPVAAVIRAKSYDEALAMANDTPFGLCSGIVTTSLKHASHFKRNAETGMVMVNLPTAGVDYHVPFGGRKGSSYGPREQGRYAAEFFTTVKTAYTAP
ncbi:MAG TPA: aldehyde dehydrogenase family protein [Casimicrobiaceae bacterium]|nr:aldehyde dehydrogenase family protein [Casimicrobiaceae bacterium]